jgi:hypothetical protein
MEQHLNDFPKLTGRTIALRPNLSGQEDLFRAFCRLLAKLVHVASDAGRQKAIEEAREEIRLIGQPTPTKGEVSLKFACSVVVDMVAQGWELNITRTVLELRSPSSEGITPEQLKNRIRVGHLLERDAQLREPSVREFIRTMEQRRLFGLHWISIFSLMRDGRELSEKLASAGRKANEEKKLDAIRATVAPYIQVVEPGATCEFTGLKLMDIWRYFRHTWVSTYKSLPGRGMAVLIRDAAFANHPVIGIAALGSSTAQQTIRDKWIGWDSETFTFESCNKPTSRLARWTYESVERLIGSIYVSDFLNEGVVERRELKNPTEQAVDRLRREAQKATERHRRFPDVADHKTNGGSPMNWRKQASTALFRSKRAKTLALLLTIRRNLQNSGLHKPTLGNFRKALKDPHGRLAIRQLVRLVKSEHVGVDMMDIIICGAVAPYNVLLGGKLVCLLLASPQVVKFYRDRYGGQQSVIASSMKGAAVTRPPNLVLLGTTSLYGVGSSQYNRVRVPLTELGVNHDARIEYDELGISKGYGSYHFSKASIDYLETLLGRAGGGRKVNSIFGEGVNPLMRKLRDGLAEVGLPTDELLKHGNPRVVYTIALAHNFRDVLLGLSARPKYFLRLTRPDLGTEELADYWRRRWLFGRIMRPGVLEEVAKHTLSYPITHGARVRLPSDESELL